MRPALAGLAVLVALCASGAARGDSAVVMIDSEADIMVESLVRVAAEDALRTARMEAAPLEASGTVTLETLRECLDSGAGEGRAEPCFTAEGNRVEADRVLLLRISAGEGEIPTVIESYLFDAGAGELLGSDRRECAGCSDPDRLAQTVEELIADILVTGQLEVEEEVVDQPVDVAVAPQPHDPRPDRPYRLWKYLALGGGAASIALGATLIAIDGPRIEDGVRQPEERASAPEGVVFVGVGLGLVAAGAVLWIWDRDDATAGESHVAPLASESAVGVAWGGRF